MLLKSGSIAEDHRNSCALESYDAGNRSLESNDPSPFLRSGEWFVLHTRSRQEKALASDLAARDISCFLPLRREVHYYGKRKCIVDAPLFSTYVFIKGSMADAYIADRSRRVANIIRCPNQQQIDWELSNIHIALLHHAPLVLYPSLVKGTRVEVRAGPFRGLRGVVEDRIKGDRLILQVETLGRALSFEVDRSLLDVIE